MKAHVRTGWRAGLVSALSCGAYILVLAFLPGCGDDDGTVCANCGPANDLVFTRADGSEIEFPDSIACYVWCGDWEPGVVEVPTLHIWFRTVALGEPGWDLRAVISDVELMEPLAFPNTFIWDQPEGVSIFLNDPPNELETGTLQSSGSITFHRLPCRDGAIVDFTIEAVLGSELAQMPTVAVTGTFRAVLTGPPGDTG